MRAGRQIRFEQALQRAGDALCECGHQMRGHRELQPKVTLEDGEVTTTPHPDYKPLHFHCGECSCVRVEAAR